MSDTTPKEVTPLPQSLQKFIDDCAELLRIQLMAPDRTLKSITITTQFWPEGKTTASESYPKPKAKKP